MSENLELDSDVDVENVVDEPIELLREQYYGGLTGLNLKRSLAESCVEVQVQVQPQEPQQTQAQAQNMENTHVLQLNVPACHLPCKQPKCNVANVTNVPVTNSNHLPLVLATAPATAPSHSSAPSITNQVINSHVKTLATFLDNDPSVLRKKIRNRESAQRARDRQKAKMKYLEEEINKLRVKNEILTKENQFLKGHSIRYGNVGEVEGLFRNQGMLLGHQMGVSNSNQSCIIEKK